MRSLENFSKSLLGSWATQSVIENIAEGAGWVTGQIGGRYIGGALGHMAFAKMGSIFGFSSSIVTSYVVGSFFEEDEQVTVKSAAITVGTAVGLSYVMPPLMEVAFGSVGEVVGGCLGALTFGTVGAYAAIKLVGSNEKLFDLENKFNNYTTKTALSVMVDKAIGIQYGFCYVDALLANQIIASITFHSIEALEFSKLVENGVALNGYLPKRVSKFITNSNNTVDLFSDVLLGELNNYTNLIITNAKSMQLLNGFKTASTNLTKAKDPRALERAMVALKAAANLLTAHIGAIVAATKESAGLNAQLTAALFEVLSEKFDVAANMGMLQRCNVEIYRSDAGIWQYRVTRNAPDAPLVAAAPPKMQALLSYCFSSHYDIKFLRNRVGSWTVQLDQESLNNLATAVQNKFKALEVYLVGREFTGARELDIIKEFVAINASNLCIFVASRYFGYYEEVCSNPPMVLKKLINEYQPEQSNKEAYKTLNHIVFSYYQVTMPTLFNNSMVNAAVRQVDRQIEGSIRC